MADNAVLRVLYSCTWCGARDREVPVRYRRADENVVDFIERVVIVAVKRAHGFRSPRCHSPSVDLKIPHPPGTEWIGGPPMQ